MKVAVYLPDTTPYSMKHCAWNIMSVLQEKHHITFTTFTSLNELPLSDIDIYWDPRCGGGIAPAFLAGAGAFGTKERVRPAVRAQAVVPAHAGRQHGILEWHQS